jgi:dephospho-CoA kinase
MNKKTKKIVLAFVGMTGSGKSEATAYLKQKNIPVVRFGDYTEELIQEEGLPLTTENEKIYREKIRREMGMNAYAVHADPKISKILKTQDIVALDGLYSWEEYIYLKDKYPNLILIHIYAEPQRRYKRLAQRKVRPILLGDSRKRDFAEIENLNKGGPIAIADYLIDNSSDNIEELYTHINKLLPRLGLNS